MPTRVKVAPTLVSVPAPNRVHAPFRLLRNGTFPYSHRAVCPTSPYLMALRRGHNIYPESLVGHGPPALQKSQSLARNANVIRRNPFTLSLSNVEIAPTRTPQHLRDASSSSTTADIPSTVTLARQGKHSNALPAALGVIQPDLPRKRPSGKDTLAANTQRADDTLHADAAANNLLPLRGNGGIPRHRPLAVARDVEERDQAVGAGEEMRSALRPEEGMRGEVGLCGGVDERVGC